MSGQMSGHRRQPSRRGQVGRGAGEVEAGRSRRLPLTPRRTLPVGSAMSPAAPRGLCSLDLPVSGRLGCRLSPGLTSRLSPLPQTREKEKMKEVKDARYTNGHLFTTISVSGMTMCYACNKSITAKEALICPSESFAPWMSL